MRAHSPCVLAESSRLLHGTGSAAIRSYNVPDSCFRCLQRVEWIGMTITLSNGASIRGDAVTFDPAGSRITDHW